MDKSKHDNNEYDDNKQPPKNIITYSRRKKRKVVPKRKRVFQSTLSFKTNSNGKTEILINPDLATIPPVSLKRKRKNKNKIGKQLYIDAGQHDLNSRMCIDCGMFYTPGLVEDESLHKRFHKQIMKEKEKKAKKYEALLLE